MMPKRLLGRLNPGLTTGVVILDRDVTQAEVVSTVTETTVYTYSVPGGTLGTTKMLRLTLQGDVLNNTGVNRTNTVRVKYGGTTLAVFDAVALSTSASRRALYLSTVLAAQNATNAQTSFAWLVQGADVGVTGADGQDTSGTGPTYAMHNAVAEDSTTALAFVVTFELSAADANLSGRCNTAHLEVL
jgi:hypothetical protein